MITEEPRVLLEQAGNLVRKVETIELSTGCRFKVKLKQERVIIRLLHSGSIEWAISTKAVLPGQPFGVSADKPTVIFLPTLLNGIYEVEVPFVTTYSFALAVSLRLKSIVGDLIEGYNQFPICFGNNRAGLWVIKQLMGSAAPIVWQIVRYDVTTCLRDWLLWYLPWYVPLWGRVQLAARSATIKFTANAAGTSS